MSRPYESRPSAAFIPVGAAHGRPAVVPLRLQLVQHAREGDGFADVDGVVAAAADQHRKAASKRVVCAGWCWCKILYEYEREKLPIASRPKRFPQFPIQCLPSGTRGLNLRRYRTPARSASHSTT